MNILNKNINILICGVCDYSACKNTTSFETLKRKDYELFKTLRNKFKKIKKIFFIKESKVTKKNILKKFSQLLFNLQKKEVFIFYFTGHGIIAKNNEPGLLMSNSDVISKSELKNILIENYKKQEIILFGDFCYSGMLADIARELKTKGIKINAITSASSNLSTGNWSYTQTLIDALNGRSIIDKKNKGYITFFDIAKEVQNVMFNRERQKSDYFLNKNLKNTILSKSKIKRIVIKGKIKYDHWYCSSDGITRVISKKNDKYEAEYYNFNHYTFKYLKESKFTSIQIADFKIGNRIKVDWEGKAHKAIVREVDRIFYKVSYVGWGKEWDEWITKDRIIGEKKVKILYYDHWFKGVILQKKNKKYFVRYKEFDSCYDEWVDHSRIKI